MNAPLEIQKLIDNNLPRYDNIPFIYNNSNTMFLSPVDTEMVERVILHKIKGSYASGYDDFPAFLLKRIARCIAPPLVHIINSSFQNGVFPTNLKVNTVVPVFKRGSAGDVSNYRPISLSSVFSKIFEYCFLEQLISFVNKYEILHNNQHGFRKGYSTTTALTEYYQKITDAIERGESPSGIFCDLSRAFDCVHHEKLLSKLSRYGIRGVPNKWVNSYLSGRSQTVKLKHVGLDKSIRSFNSRIAYVDIGVPQGSVLGPILFILYMNDLCPSIGAHTTMYADDTSLLVSDCDSTIYQDKIDAAVREMSLWFNNNSLYLNAEKTKHILFHTRQRLLLPEIEVMIGNAALCKQSSASFLGVIFDEGLTFLDHCMTLVKRVNIRCYQIRNLRTVLNISSLLNCYYGLVHSILSYGIIVWGSSVSWRDVFIAQKRVIRCCAGVKSGFSCRGLFRSFKILPLPCIYIRELVSYVFENRSGLTTHENIHSHNTRKKHNLIAPYRHLNLSINTPFCLGIRLFNLLPDSCKRAGSLKLFRFRVKALLTDLCCYSLDEYIQAMSS